MATFGTPAALGAPRGHPLEPRNDKVLRIGGIALLLLSSCYYRQLFVRPPDWISVKMALESLTIIVLTWEACRGILIGSRRRYPHLAQSRRRLGWALPACWAAAALVDGLDMVAVNATHVLPAYSLRAILNAIPGSLLTTMIAVGAQEAFYYFTRTAQAEREAEELKRENLQTQLESLKQQVNPHFLFNSLNTLSYLVGEDAARADVFLNELCKVYRYLLQTNAQGLTTVAAELQFIRSYFHLLQTRYGDCLGLHLDVAPAYEQYRLPSLTLQLLVENAVKHNVLHRDQPLAVQIHTHRPGWLTVTNNLQRKPQAGPSEQIGLRNIIRKFELLGQPAVQIAQTVTEFRVELPLLAGAAVEGPAADLFPASAAITHA